MSLEGRMIAISIGDAPDRGRLGYPQREVDRVLLSVCTALVRAGARIVYGGNLDPAGFRIDRDHGGGVRRRFERAQRAAHPLAR